MFCSFLALRLKAEAERRMDEWNETWEWAKAFRGLDNLQEVEAFSPDIYTRLNGMS